MIVIKTFAGVTTSSAWLDIVRLPEGGYAVFPVGCRDWIAGIFVTARDAEEYVVSLQDQQRAQLAAAERMLGVTFA